MAIASHKPTNNGPITPKVANVQPTEYKSAVVDDNRMPIASLISFVEGAPWSVDYYSQIIGKDNDLRDLDVEQSSTTQTYSKVIGLEIRTTSDLQSSHDTEKGITTVTGNGIIYPFIVPNIGDTFVASIANNHKAIFRIKSVERSTYHRDSVYNVDYDMICYVDSEPGRITGLESKVATTFFYHKDRLAVGLNPTVIKSEHELILSLNEWYDRMVKYYFKNFLNREKMTLIVPGQEDVIYDPHLTGYILKIVDTFDAPEIREVKHINISDDRFINQPTLWNCLLERSMLNLPQVNYQTCLVTSTAFDHDPMLKGIRYTGIQYVVYPSQPDTSILGDNFDLSVLGNAIALQETNSPKMSMVNLLNDDVLETTTNVNRAVPWLVPVTSDEYYVFTKGFYENTTTESILEALTLNYLKNEAISRDHLNNVAKAIWKADRLEQYYYMPVILTLLKASISSS